MKLRKITFINEYNGQYKEAPVDFSWTTLFFGFFPAMIRRDWKWVILQFSFDCITFGLSWLVMPFFYNKLYIKDLLSKGFVPIDEDEIKYLVARGIMSRLHMELLNKIREKLIQEVS